jgi:sporulation-control protein spo0M
MYEARIYVGIQTAIPIQMAARFHKFQVRFSTGIGARSALNNEDSDSLSCLEIVLSAIHLSGFKILLTLNKGGTQQSFDDKISGY